MLNPSNNAFSAQRWENSTHELGHDVVCHVRDKSVFSGGIWFGQDPLQRTLPVLMVQITLAFFASRAVHFVLRPLKQPKFVSNLLGGIILGPSVLGRNQTFRDKVFPPREELVLNTMATIGVVYIIFLIAVKTDTAMILTTGRKAWSIGISCLVVPFSIMACLNIILNNYLSKLPEGPFRILLPASVSITAFPVLAQALDELNLLTSELGQLAMSSALLNDMIGWFFMVLGDFLQQKHSSHSIGFILSLCAMMTFTIYVLRPAILWIIKRTPEGKPVKEIYIITILVGVLVMAFISDIIGATVVDGPLLLGFVIPDGPPLGATLVEKTELLVVDFLLPLFFLVIGVGTDVFSIRDWRTFATFQFIIIMGYIAKLVATLLSSLFCKMSLRNALSLSIMMNIRGVIEVITFTHWKAHKIVDDQSYATLVLSTLAVTAIVTPLTEILYKPPRRFNGAIKQRGRTIQTTPPTAELRILFCIHNDGNVHSIITLLEASNPTEESPICAYVIHLIELVGRAAPLLVPHNKHKRQSKHTSSDHIMRAFKKYSKNSDGRVTALPFTMVAPFKSMHEGICRLAQDKLIPLIIIPFHENQEIHGGKSNDLRNLNSKIQAHAPCTVGILVDKGFHCHMIHTHFSYHVAVLFLGGTDDREVLAYGTRMSGHPGVSITVWRILLWDDENDNESERQLDDSLVNEFKLKNINNACAVYREVVVEDRVQAMAAIRSTENIYDLVMVGQRRGTNTLFDEEMVNWSENVELGVVGDVIASLDFCGGTVSVLVIQHFGEVDGAILNNSMMVEYEIDSELRTCSGYS